MRLGKPPLETDEEIHSYWKRKILRGEDEETVDIRARKRRKRAQITTEIAWRAVYLIEVEELTFKDASKVLDISERSVYKILRSARRDPLYFKKREIKDLEKKEGH